MYTLSYNPFNYSLNPRLGAGERQWFIVPNYSLEKLLYIYA
jgi:hypothetical protein